MMQTRNRLIGLTLVAGGLFIWATWPGAGSLRLETCSPDGVFPSLSSSIYGKKFWLAQLSEIVGRRSQAENWDRFREQIRSEEEKGLQIARETIDKVFRDSPELAPSATQRLAQQLRDRADAIERSDQDRIVSAMMKETAEALRRCEAIVREKLR